MTNEPAGVVRNRRWIPLLQGRRDLGGGSNRWNVENVTRLDCRDGHERIALGAIFALASMVPLKSYEPYMIVVDKSSGFVEVKRPMRKARSRRTSR